jgi:DNA polymerase III subunit beta
MKLQVTQENLSRALNNVARVASTKNALPILSNVLIKTVDNRLVIAATNLNIAITHYIGSKVTQEGSITVPARLMQDFVASLPAGVIDIKVDETKLRIKADKYNSTINGTPSDDYPVMPNIKDGTTWTVSGGDLKRALQQVVLAASHDEARPILTGIYFHTSEGSLYIAATDSYRLAEKRVKKLNQEVKLLIPATAMQDLLRIIGDYDEEITVTHDDQQVLFTVGDIELITRLIDGTYPDYRKLIPASFSTYAKLPKSELINITKVSSLFARESAGSVTLELDEDEKQISIRSIASQLGENTAKAEADVTGSGSITLNSRYILDALGVIDETDTTISFNGKLEPCVIQGTGSKDYLHLIMPLKS